MVLIHKNCYIYEIYSLIKGFIVFRRMVELLEEYSEDKPKLVQIRLVFASLKDNFNK